MTVWRDNREFNDALDGVYRSFMRQKPHVEGKHDRDVRDPHVVLGVARKLDLLPPPEAIVRVTGSKGKGTTSRMIAKLLMAQHKGKVGLFVSPEELDHNDRMRVDGKVPTREEFSRIYKWLEPELEAAQTNLAPRKYISPFGAFLLIALKYFKDQGVDFYVLECGRGAEFDEVGNIRSHISVVTSILLEHAANIGPTHEDVARNKFFVGSNSSHVVTTPAVQMLNSRLGCVAEKKLLIAQPAKVEQSKYPDWLGVDAGLAQLTVATLLDTERVRQVDLLDSSAAFGMYTKNGQPVYFDGSINLDSIDQSFFEDAIASSGVVTVLASLPDDKDVDRMRAYFKGFSNVTYYQIALSGTRGYLHYNLAKENGTVHAEIHYEDTASFVEIVTSTNEAAQSDVIYCIGTQTYIRLVKMALGREESGV